MDYSNPENIKLLRNLLNQENNKDCESGSGESSEVSQSVGERKEYKNYYEALPQAERPQMLADDEWEACESILSANALDERKSPDYRIVYKQSVAPEDIYLCMGNRTPATASCEEMCVEIDLLEETVSVDQMTLDVSTDCVDLLTPVYHLKLPLVHKVYPDRGSAAWDAGRRVLRLSLHMKRELDFVNF